MNEITEQMLVELKNQYEKETDRLIAVLQKKANKSTDKMEMYSDVFDKLYDTMLWMYSQLDAIKELKKSNYERQVKAKDVKWQINLCEANISKIMSKIVYFEEQEKRLIAEQKKFIFAEKMSEYKAALKGFEAVKKEPIKQAGEIKTAIYEPINNNLEFNHSEAVRWIKKLSVDRKIELHKKTEERIMILLELLQHSATSVNRIKHNPFKRDVAEFEWLFNDIIVNVKQLPAKWEQAEKDRILIDNENIIAKKQLVYTQELLQKSKNFAQLLDDDIKAVAELQAENEFQKWKNMYEAKNSGIDARGRLQ